MPFRPGENVGPYRIIEQLGQYRSLQCVGGGGAEQEIRALICRQGGEQGLGRAVGNLRNLIWNCD